MCRRRVCVVTGSRAEYDQLYWLLKEIEKESSLVLQLVVTGMHLSSEHGLTVTRIEEDGFTVTSKIEAMPQDTSASSITKSVGVGLIKFSDLFKSLCPDVVVLLGDRYELFAPAIATLFQRIPLVHICGGERTDASLDELIRHSITKMASIHFVSEDAYRRRVIQLGEHPTKVMNYGDLGVESVRRTNRISLAEFGKKIGFDLSGSPYFLVTYHPETTKSEFISGHAIQLLRALAKFPDHVILFTGANADHGGNIINDLFRDYANRFPKKYIFVQSLGRENYIAAMTYATLVLGNSSSGIVEAPVVGIPTINIGERQQGRIMVGSIFTCSHDTEDIVRTITEVLLTVSKKDSTVTIKSEVEYSTAKRIKDYLRDADLRYEQKLFFDIPQ